MLNRKTVATGLIGLLALGGTVATVAPDAIAQSTNDTSTIEQRPTLEQRLDRAAERIQSKLAAGEITQAQADEALANIAAGELPRHKGRDRNHKMAVLTELLGISAEDLREARQAGTPLVDVAAEAGVSEQDLIDTLVEAAQERVATGLAEGRIDQAKADEILAGLEDRISEKVNSVSTKQGHRHRAPTTGD